MDKRIYRLVKRLFEDDNSLLSGGLFDDIFTEEDDDSVLDYARNNIKDIVSFVLLSLYNLALPDGWKEVEYEFRGKNMKAVTYSNKAKLTSRPVKLARVLNILVNDNGFKEYKSSNNPYAYIYNTKVKELRTSKTWMRREAVKAQRELEEWKQESKSYPDIVMQFFNTDPKYKTIWLSPDNGIIIIHENTIDTKKDASIVTDWDDGYQNTYYIAITGEVPYDYSIIADNKAIAKATNAYKNRQNASKFIDFFFKKVGTTFVKNYGKHMLFDKDGVPFYIGFFNMSDDIFFTSFGNGKIPNIIYKLTSLGYKFLTELEKDDKTSKWELVTDATHIYIYDYIPEQLEKYVNDRTKIWLNRTKVSKMAQRNCKEVDDHYISGTVDSLMVLKLDSFAVDIYKDRFNNK